MQTEIINIGDELLIGQVINTNASWMAEKMNLSGFAVHQVTVIRDDEQHILDALDEAKTRADIILITGGLGPTKDDITKKTLCRYFHTHMVFNPEVYADIEHLFKERGFAMTPLNKLQAEVPENCTTLRNKNGTAPGMWFEQKREGGEPVVFVSMPGVPFEMKPLLEDEVIPRLKNLYHPNFIFHKTILTQGVGESFLSDMIEPWELQLPGHIHLAYLPQPGLVRLRLSGSGDNEPELHREILSEVEKLRAIAGAYIYGEDDDTLESLIGKLLLEKVATLAVAESCTGGNIGNMITSVSGSSGYFKGGVIAYANEIKENELGVQRESLDNYGAVSEQVVKEMADGIRRKFKTTYAIATSGVAGPTGGTAEKPVGLTWIAISSPEKTIAFRFLYGENRERNIRKAS
ncbi:MAG TPA: competence/damage-inducible protein A, partial [Bacteroidales bacterium]|nr:competence/damage-inducible protein A [Bacteroidales bacterium]